MVLGLRVGRHWANLPAASLTHAGKRTLAEITLEEITLAELTPAELKLAELKLADFDDFGFGAPGAVSSRHWSSLRRTAMPRRTAIVTICKACGSCYAAHWRLAPRHRSTPEPGPIHRRCKEIGGGKGPQIQCSLARANKINNLKPTASASPMRRPSLRSPISSEPAPPQPDCSGLCPCYINPGRSPESSSPAGALAGPVQSSPPSASPDRHP